MGKSSTGKDTIAKELLKDQSLNLKTIIMYTTRPIRDNENDGSEYYFINDDKLNAFIHSNKVIELRTYNTVKGLWSYATVDDGQVDLEKDHYLLIGTLEAYINLSKYFGKENIVPLYIIVDDGIRLERALRRERKQSNPDYEEMCRRFIADNKDFSEDKLNSANIVKCYKNDNLVRCMNEIKDDIIKYINK